MAYSEPLASRIREALLQIPNLPPVEEKKMFSGIVFMVDDKMCMGVLHDDLMVRVNPAEHEELVQRKGARTMMMKDRAVRGYILITQTNLANDADFHFWLTLALSFNKHTKSSKKKNVRTTSWAAF